MQKGCYCFESRRYVISWWNILIQVSVLTVTPNTRFVSMSNAIQTSLEANHFRSQEFSCAMSDDRKLLLHNPFLTWMNDIAI